MAGVGKIAFEKRRIGDTGLEVSALGLGCASLAGNFVAVSEADAKQVVADALDAGITYLDTAPQYGLGRSEHFVGDVFRDRRSEAVLATKVGGLLKPYAGSEKRGNWANPFPFKISYDYSYDAIMRAFDDSRQRMAIPEIDILYVHDIGVMTHGPEKGAEHWRNFANGGYRAIRELKSAGLIKAIGLGVNEWEVLLDAIELGDWDVFLLAGRYTLLEQTSLDPFFTKCVEHGVSVVAAAPFNGGALMGTGTWNYGSAPKEIIDRVARLEKFCADRNVPIGAAALQFPLAHKAVCNVLVGPKNPAELKGILDWWQVKIPDSFWDDLADAGLVTPGTPLNNGRTA